MSDYIIAVSKKDKGVTEENLPNSFIFHSDYNSFKIVKTGIMTCTVVASTNNQEFTTQHGLTFTPLVTAFAKDAVEDEAYPPNTAGVNFYFPTISLQTNECELKKIGADATNVIAIFNNTDTENHVVAVRYFCLETI